MIDQGFAAKGVRNTGRTYPHLRKTHCINGHERTPDNVTTRGQCKRCFFEQRQGRTNLGVPQLTETQARDSLDAWMRERQARNIPWHGTAKDPDVFREERKHPGTHRHTPWAGAA